MRRLEDELVLETPLAIPKILHFVWAGGKKLMPRENRECVLSWLQQNPDFAAYIWIDQQSYSDPGALTGEYQAQFSILAQSLPLNDPSLIDRIEYRDIEQEEVSDPYSRYEIDRLRPNYGASSDLLRYRILSRFGGMYLDSDVKPSDEANLSALEAFTQTHTEHRLYHRLYVDDHSQGSSEVGNDVLVSTPGNPAMALIHDIAQRNYHQRATPLNCTFDERPIALAREQSLLLNRSEVYAYDDYSSNQGYILASTPIKTGPGCVQALTTPEHDPDNTTVNKSIALADKTVGIPVCALPQHIFTPEKSNARDWVARPIKEYDNLNRLIDEALSSLQFEIEALGFFRLDDCISNVVESIVRSRLDFHLLKKDKQSAKDKPDMLREASEDQTTPLNHLTITPQAFQSIRTIVARHLIGKINERPFDFSQIHSVQLTYRHPETKAFYQTRGLLDRTLLLNQASVLLDSDASEAAITHVILSPLIKQIIGAHHSVQAFEKLTALRKCQLAFDIYAGKTATQEALIAGSHYLDAAHTVAELRLLSGYFLNLENTLQTYLPICQHAPFVSLYESLFHEPLEFQPHLEKLARLRERISSSLNQQMPPPPPPNADNEEEASCGPCFCI